VGLVAALLAAGISWLRPPLPYVHDEFSYLLAADTFAGGRLANPPHPMWRHFETFHVLQQPTYASKYPPAQGMLLACGQVLAGSPVVGLWIGAGLAAAAVTWMLQGWLPPRWALVGGWLVALHGNLHVLWGQTYWGGDVAMLGGSLLLGAYPRLVRHARIRDALALATGLAILANSRPYEGLAVSLPVAVALLSWLRGPGRPVWRSTCRIAGTLGLTLGITGLWMAYYNACVTGRADVLPYVVYQRTYSHIPLFLWDSPRPAVDGRHEVMRRFAREWEHGAFQDQQSISGYLRAKLHFLVSLWNGLLGVAWTLALIAGSGRFVKRRWRVPLMMLGAALLATAGTTWNDVHYLAPAVGPLVLAIVVGIRRISILTWRRKSRRSIVAQGLVLSQIPAYFLFVGLYLAGPSSEFGSARARILADLERTAERHLVVVHYQPDHNPPDEWVYNRASIDTARVVWARSLGFAADRRLRAYFRDRRVWLLDADAVPPRLMSYPDPVAMHAPCCVPSSRSLKVAADRFGAGYRDCTTTLELAVTMPAILAERAILPGGGPKEP